MTAVMRSGPLDTTFPSTMRSETQLPARSTTVSESAVAASPLGFAWTGTGLSNAAVMYFSTPSGVVTSCVEFVP